MPASAAPARSVPDLLRRRADDHGLAQRVKRLGLWQPITWAQYAADVNAVAAWLIDMGLEPGQRVAVLSENRPEWAVADLAVQTAGGVTVGVYTTSSPEQLHYYLHHSDAVGLILEDAEQLEKWLAIRKNCPAVSWVLLIEPEEVDGIERFDDAIAVGREQYLRDPKAVEARLESIDLDDTAIFIYTSGTTGEPKGAMLSHRNILWAIDALHDVIEHSTSDELLSFLPMSHIVERLLSVMGPLKAGYTVSFTENLDTVLANLQEIRPTIFFAVPRIWEKMFSLVELHMKDAQFIKRAAYQWAMTGSRLRVRSRLTRQAEASATAAASGLADGVANLLVHLPLKRRLGLDRVRIAISGAAPIAPEILAYFRALGIDIREGYGLTESCGLIAIHKRDVRLGTVGTEFKGVEMRIADDGEIMSRSPGNFTGYHKDAAATAAALEDGWLRTGDIGVIDDGHLRITDRKKDILITAGGKNIAPQKIENQLKSSIYINDAVVLGDRRKYLIALLVLDEDNVGHWAAERQLAYTTYTDLTKNQDVLALIGAEVETVNASLARVETVKRFAILPRRLHQEDGEVTATLKVKRSSIAELYQDLIEELYD
ncbi:MAG TPA: long-chain fatty acid--CoA ligase [Trueperaceae bacterium]|nr:long-chain fatty acid--CoA ligase [Trueperaceae bacterium]